MTSYRKYIKKKDWETTYRLLHHYNSLSNKMDNSLLAVRGINHKYIVVDWRTKVAFGIGMNPGREAVGVVKGSQIRVACACWFTSTGKIMPLMLKVQDENGEIRTIREMTIHSQEKKMYAGIPSVEYDCTLIEGERNIRARLIYYQTEGRWVLNFR